MMGQGQGRGQVGSSVVWTNAARCCRAARHAQHSTREVNCVLVPRLPIGEAQTSATPSVKGAFLTAPTVSVQGSCAGVMGGDAEDVKVKPEGVSNVINIVVKDQNSGEVHFKVKPTTKFVKIFDAYAGKKGVEPANIKFLYDGQRIRDHQTPGELGIEDNDVVDCLLEQVGGTLQ